MHKGNLLRSFNTQETYARSSQHELKCNEEKKYKALHKKNTLELELIVEMKT